MEDMERPAMKSVFENIYRDKTILITGDTGFKGTWLSIWLTLLGAKVIGYSLYLPSRPCLFSVCRINENIKHVTGDIRSYDSLNKVLVKYEPDFIFHLAAQPIVGQAYRDPKVTFETNVLGTVNVLESIRKSLKRAVAIIITSDKCYKNMEWDWGYRETDTLGGNDPYSSSKACAELVCQAYYKSFFSKQSSRYRMATARAGNVIGGGDWAVDRIIPDCVRAWSCNKTVKIRNPKATRPWQHVLEPLSGYLWLGVKLFESERLNGESFNFGPDYKASESVAELIKIFSKYFSGNNKWKYLEKKISTKENMFLKVSCDKALKLLDWHGILSFSDTIKTAAEWYEEYYRTKNRNMLDFTIGQIDRYVAEAEKLNLAWSES
jgi:CDP-glucose 4,6-dehydratase